MLILDQRTMQIKYRWYFTNIITITIIFIITITINIIISKVITIYARVPAGEIFKLSLSPYFDDIAVFHVRGVKVSIISIVFLGKIHNCQRKYVNTFDLFGDQSGTVLAN